jgi:putative DNA primase/helicase
MRYLDDGTAASIEKPLERAVFQDPDFTPENVARNRTKLRRAWKHSTPLNGTDAASRYLQMRVPGCDITKLAVGLRYNRSMQFWEEDDKGKFVQRGYFPVMLGLAIDKDGHAITCHRTYLTADGRKAPFENVKKQMKGVRKLDGAAVRVIDVPESRVLGLTEGIENAVAVGTAYRYSINVWSTLNCSNLEMVEIPEGRFDKIVIFADHDQLDPKTNRRPGLHYVELLKARLEAAGYTVELKVPPVEGTDFADLWNEVYQARQQARRDKLQRQARETAQCPGNIVHGPLLAPQTPSTTRVLHA